MGTSKPFKKEGRGLRPNTSTWAHNLRKVRTDVEPRESSGPFLEPERMPLCSRQPVTSSKCETLKGGTLLVLCCVGLFQPQIQRLSLFFIAPPMFPIMPCQRLHDGPGRQPPVLGSGVREASPSGFVSSTPRTPRPSRPRRLPAPLAHAPCRSVGRRASVRS